MTAHSSPDTDELSAHSAEDQLNVPDPDPPSYPASVTIPDYTPRPAQGFEQTIIRGPPTAAELTASVEYSAKRFNVSFGGQSIGRTPAQGPEYSRGSKIRGTITIDERWKDKIASVELKVGRSLTCLASSPNKRMWGKGPRHHQTLDT